MPYKFQSIFGWTDFFSIYNDASDKYNDCLFVEIGSFQGKSAVMMGEMIKEKGKNIKLVCIDIFPTVEELDIEKEKGSGQGEEANIIRALPKSLLNTFVENTRKCEVDDVIIPIKSDSHKAAVLFPDEYFPFVFIDGGHGYDCLMKDLQLWYPKVITGCTIAGHDVSDIHVNRAVKDFFGNLGVKFEIIGDSWIAEKKN